MGSQGTSLGGREGWGHGDRPVGVEGAGSEPPARRGSRVAVGLVAWLPQEGVCILTGLGFNGFDEYGTAKWDACANMKVWLFRTNPRFTGTIASFNINTNTWVSR